MGRTEFTVNSEKDLLHVYCLLHSLFRSSCRTEWTEAAIHVLGSFSLFTLSWISSVKHICFQTLHPILPPHQQKWESGEFFLFFLELAWDTKVSRKVSNPPGFMRWLKRINCQPWCIKTTKVECLFTLPAQHRCTGPFCWLSSLRPGLLYDATISTWASKLPCQESKSSGRTYSLSFSTSLDKGSYRAMRHLRETHAQKETGSRKLGEP